MKLLLDTHVVLWWRTNDQRLGADARRAILEARTVFVSAASAWEVAIKIGLGKLRLEASFEEGIVASQFVRLSVQFKHAAAVAELPVHHRDPFDRMLVAQALVESLVLVSADRRFEPYGTPVLWT